MDPSESLQKALHYLQTAAPAKCVSLCDEILAGNPGLIQALYLRGCASMETGDIARSISDLEIVHDNHPEHLHAAYYLGRSLRVAGRFDDALAPLRTALGADEFVVPAHYELAICLSCLRRRSAAPSACSW